MKNVRRLVSRNQLRNALAISQIALHELEIGQLRKSNRAALQVRSDYIPTLRLKKFYQMGANKPFSSRHDCSLFRQNFLLSLLIENAAYTVEERLSFLFPGVCQVDLLAVACDSDQVVTLGIAVQHLFGEI